MLGHADANLILLYSRISEQGHQCSHIAISLAMVGLGFCNFQSFW